MKAGVAEQTIRAAIEAVNEVVRAIPANPFSTSLAEFGLPPGKKR